MKGAARTPDTAFWVDRADVDGTRLRLSASESRHLLRVFRAAPGTPFEAVDGEGILYRCVLETASGGIAVGTIESQTREAGELGAAITLLAGLPDLQQIETVVSLAVPLGATAIDFVATGHSGREPLPEARLERLTRIARSAVKQSRRTRLPALRSSPNLEEAIQDIPVETMRLFADPGGQPLRSQPAEAALQMLQPHVVLAVGPPGGFLREEGELLTARGFRPISLGPSRLTTSAASLALLAATRNLMLTAGLGRVDKTGLSGYLQ
jgi:16S rRNA (uracil1498-N3)-methyltransferase